MSTTQQATTTDPALPYFISQWVMPAASFTGIWCRHLNSRAAALTKTQWTCQQSILPSEVFNCAVNGSKINSLGKMTMKFYLKEGSTVKRCIYPDVSSVIISWKAVKVLGILPHYYPNPIPLITASAVTKSFQVLAQMLPVTNACPGCGWHRSQNLNALKGYQPVSIGPGEPVIDYFHHTIQ